MKITPIPTAEPPPAFKPITLQFTFETQEELDCFGSIFNHCQIYSSTFKEKRIGSILGENIWKDMLDIGADIHNTAVTLKFNL